MKEMNLLGQGCENLSSRDSSIFEEAQQLATWPVRMTLPLLDNPNLAIDTGGGVDKLLRGDSNVRVINRTGNLIGPKAYWHLDGLSRFFGGSLEGKRLLDIGCGTGYVSALAAMRGARVMATEMHQKNISRANLVFKCFQIQDLAKVEKIDMQCMDPERLGCFDAVLFLGTIYHCEYPLDVLFKIAQMTNSLVVDARIALPGQVNDNLWGLEFFREEYSDQNQFSSIRRVGGGVIRKPTRESLVEMLRLAGFKEIYQSMPYAQMQEHFLKEEFIQFVAFK